MSEQISDIDDVQQDSAVATKSTRTKKAATVEGGAAQADSRRMVTIHTTGDDDGQNAVNIGVNGYVYNIPRGIPVPLPEEAIEALTNAKYKMWREVNKEMQAFEVPRFSYTIH